MKASKKNKLEKITLAFLNFWHKNAVLSSSGYNDKVVNANPSF